MSEHRYGVHDCPNGFYYLRDVTDHSVYVHRNYGKLFSEYKEDIELVSTLLNELADKVDEQQSKIRELEEEKMELEKKLECCEYEHFINELDKIHEKIDKGDYSDFKTLKQEEKDKQIEEDYARLQRRKILERSGNCEPLTLKYNPNTTYMG